MEDLEREAIIENYNKGPRAVPAGDDEDYGIYRRVDQLGLLHEEELPPLSAQEKKKNIQTARRVDKWIKMLNNWGKYKNSAKLRRRVYNGIPPQVRGRVWALLLGLDKIKIENAGEYEHLKELGKAISPHIRVIDKEVRNIFRGHIMFSQRYGTKQQELFHVLLTYSIYNPDVGHCHYLSQLAALLLIYLTEEEAFWALDEIVTSDNHLMHDFFTPGRPKLARFLTHLDNVLRMRLPKLKRHLDQEQLPSRAYAAQWFVECFLHRTPFSLALRVFDIFMLDGERVLSSMAYTTLALHEKRLLTLPREGLRKFLSSRLAKPWKITDDKVIEHLQASMSLLRRLGLDLPPPAVPGRKPTMPPQNAGSKARTGGLCRRRRQWKSVPNFPVNTDLEERYKEKIPFFLDLNSSHPSGLAWLVAPPRPSQAPKPVGQQAANCKTPQVPPASNTVTLLRSPSEGCLGAGRPALPPRASSVA